RASSASDEGLAAWLAWSAKSAKHQEAACLERWQHWFRSPPDRIGYASLYHLARMANPLWVKPSLIAGNTIVAGRGGVAPPAGEDWESNLSNPPQAARSAPAAAMAAETAPSLIATPFEPDQLAKLPPREWVYGHFLIRRFVSVLGAPGGTGKTAYAIAVGLAVALGRPLVEEPVHSQGAVWIYNLEDPREELLRRVQAALIAHGIRPATMTGRLYLDSGRDQPLILAVRLPDGSTVATPIADALIAELIRREVRLLIVDPFVKSHRLEENRNEQVDFAATLWSRVADAAGCAILLVHHFRKGGVAGDADAFRGASALVDAARAAVALRSMDDGEAKRFGIAEEERWFYVRADNAKL
ncbi:MAG: AAA family ATPase, partial [Acetobacteraceae bacterium]